MDEPGAPGSQIDPSQKDAAATAPPDAAPMALVAARDIGFAVALLSLFGGADAWRIATGTFFASTVSTLAGLVTGFGVGFLAHEWGHFVGARISGATSPLRPASSLGFIFDFDLQGSSRHQFDTMSIGGNVGHFSVVLLFLLALPLETPGQVALLAGAIGNAVFASSVEFPVIAKSRSGMAPADALGTIPRDFLKRSGSAGLAAALLVLLFL